MRTGLAWLMLAAMGAAVGADETRGVEEKIPGTIVRFEMVRVPGGVVQVREGETIKRVEVKPFWIGRTEVTWDEYDVWLDRRDLTEQQKVDGVDGTTRPSQPYVLADRGWGHSGNPVIGVTAHAATMYCRWLSEKTGKRYRLASEAEWELACRAGQETEPATDAEALGRVAWFAGNSRNEEEERAAHAVGTKAANAWGLHDMLGNVAEWTVGVEGTMVTKGGSFQDRAEGVTSRTRRPFDPKWQRTDPEEPKSQWWLRDGPQVGFRVVREE